MKLKFFYLLIYVGMWFLVVFLFLVLYVLFDFIYFWLYYVIGYWRKVVCINLKNFFLEKLVVELKVIECKFFYYFCDYMFEDVKMLCMLEKEFCKWMIYENKEIYFWMIDEWGGIVLLIFYYVNFEWIMGMGMIMCLGDVFVQVYKFLKDVYLDGFFKYICVCFGGYNVLKYFIVCEVIKLKCVGKKMVIGLIID